MISRLLTLIVAITAGASAEPIRFLSGVYDSNGKTSWGTFSNLTVEYSPPADPIDTFHEIRGEGYVFCPVPLRIVDNDQDVLFSGTFGIEGLILWVPNDAVTPYFHGIIEGTLSPRFAQALGFGESGKAYDAIGLFTATPSHYYAGGGWDSPPGEWGLYIEARQHAPVPEPALFIPTAAVILVLGARVNRNHPSPHQRD